MNSCLYVLFFLMCSLFINGCASPKSTNLLEREVSHVSNVADKQQIALKEIGGGATDVRFASERETGGNVRSNRNDGGESLQALLTKESACYDNVSNKLEDVSLSGLIWTKKQFNSSGIKGRAAIKFSATSENALNITFIVDGHATRQEALIRGVDFDVHNASIILNDAFGAAVNGGARPNNISLRPEGNKIIATINASEQHEFKKNELACNLKK